MREPVRNLLVYADGRVHEINQRIEGRHFFQTEERDTGYYERRFNVDIAASGRYDEPGSIFTIVAIEASDDAAPFPERDDRVTINARATRIDAPNVSGRSPVDIHLECLQNGGHRAEGYAEHCTTCGLSGYVIRAATFEIRRRDRERTEAGALRDQLVKLRDENTKIKVENSDLRREVERLQRRASV